MECKDFIEWSFNGIGTTLIGILLSFFAGYKTGVHRTIKQKQIGVNSVNQTQVANVKCTERVTEIVKENETTSIVQNQKAGNNSVQKQVGGLQDVRK